MCRQHKVNNCWLKLLLSDSLRLELQKTYRCFFDMTHTFFYIFTFMYLWRRRPFRKFNVHILLKLKCKTIEELRIKEESWRLQLMANLNTQSCYCGLTKTEKNKKYYQDYYKQKVSCGCGAVITKKNLVLASWHVYVCRIRVTRSPTYATTPVTLILTVSTGVTGNIQCCEPPRWWMIERGGVRIFTFKKTSYFGVERVYFTFVQNVLKNISKSFLLQTSHFCFSRGGKIFCVRKLFLKRKK